MNYCLYDAESFFKKKRKTKKHELEVIFLPSSIFTKYQPHTRMFIVEISYPYDAFVNTFYNTQFTYYQPLNETINVATSYSCKKITLIVGSLGTIHNSE